MFSKKQSGALVPTKNEFAALIGNLLVDADLTECDNTLRLMTCKFLVLEFLRKLLRSCACLLACGGHRDCFLAPLPSFRAYHEALANFDDLY